LVSLIESAGLDTHNPIVEYIRGARRRSFIYEEDEFPDRKRSSTPKVIARIEASPDPEDPRLMYLSPGGHLSPGGSTTRTRGRSLVYDMSPEYLRAYITIGAEGKSKWAGIRGMCQLPRQTVKMRLFCFAQAGMGASSFERWDVLILSGIEVIPVELPGYGLRMNEPFMSSLCGAAEAAAEALEGFTDKPYAVLGHSLGGWIAYEFVQALLRRGKHAPVKAYFSAIRAPHLFGPHHDLDVQTPTLSTLKSRQVFWTAFERRYGSSPDLQNPAVKEFVFPRLQAAFKLLEEYQPSSHDPLSCPINTFGAHKDSRYTPEQLNAWQAYTSAEYSEHWFHTAQEDDSQWGTPHRYIIDNPLPVIDFMGNDLSQIFDTTREQSYQHAYR